MPSPSSPKFTQGNPLKIHVFGHEGADPEGVAHSVGGSTHADVYEDCDLAIFAINAAQGIDAETIETWEVLSESMVPRIIAVTGIEGVEADFDDAVLLANRVFDQTVTPYLVLHDEAGIACALIDLANLRIIDYSSSVPTISDSDPEHKTLVSEFRQEYLEALEIAGEDGFAAGMLFPAIPVWLEKGIGVDILQTYISKINS
ncbi:MAG: hypothetical protein NTX12_07240 [Actinobacteria bacterium]|nr:hypothetical protein [Actinomycetota bacterium]